MKDRIEMTPYRPHAHKPMQVSQIRIAPKRGAKRAITPEEKKQIISYIAKNPSEPINELKKRFQRKFKVEISGFDIIQMTADQGKD